MIAVSSKNSSKKATCLTCGATGATQRRMQVGHRLHCTPPVVVVTKPTLRLVRADKELRKRDILERRLIPVSTPKVRGTPAPVELAAGMGMAVAELAVAAPRKRWAKKLVAVAALIAVALLIAV